MDRFGGVVSCPLVGAPQRFWGTGEPGYFHKGNREHSRFLAGNKGTIDFREHPKFEFWRTEEDG